MKFVFFVLGLILFMLGFALYLQGPRRYVQYESENLGYWTKSISAGNSERITWYFSGSGQYFVSDLTLVMNVSVLDRPLWVYILNNLQFGTWEEEGTIGQAFLSRNVTDRFDWAFETRVNETYHFVVKNPWNVRSSIVLSLRDEGNFLHFDYTLTPLYIILFTFGLGVCLLLARGCSQEFNEFLKNWSLPIYRPLGKRIRDKEEAILHFEAILLTKRLAKYFVLIILFCAAVVLIYEQFSPFVTIVNWSIRFDLKLFAIDLLIRSFILGTMLILPFLVGLPLYLLIIQPREQDLSNVLKSKLGFQRRTRKQWLIEKSMYRKIVQATLSFRFLFLCCLLFLPLILIYMFSSQLATVVYITSFVSVLSIWAGYTAWSSFNETCVEKGIGRYAADRYMKSSSIDLSIGTVIGWLCVSLMVLFASSHFWISTIVSIVIEPLALPEDFFPEFPTSTIQFRGFIGISATFFAFVILAFLFLVIFPYLHRIGLKGVVGFFVVFGLTYMTENLSIWILQGQVRVITEPIGLVSPVIAALVAQVAQGRYNKLVKRLLLA